MEKKGTLVPEGNQRKYLNSNQEIHYIFADGGRKDGDHDIIIPAGARCEVSSGQIDDKIVVGYNGHNVIITQDRFKEVFGDETIYQGRLETHNFESLIHELPFLNDYVICNEGTKANLFTIKRIVESNGSKKYVLTISQEYDIRSPLDENTSKGGIKDAEKYTVRSRTFEIQGNQFDALYGFMNKITKKKKTRPSNMSELSTDI